MNDNAPLFSIAMPAYSAAQTLGEALDSVLAQTFADWELVIVVKDSPDATMAIASEYASKDARVRVMQQADNGCGAARTTAINNSLGRYIVRFDADDILMPNYLEEMAAFVGEHPDFDIFECNGWRLLPDGTKELMHVGAEYERVLSLKLEDMLSCNLLFGIAVFDRRLMDLTGGFRSGVYTEDYDFWLRAMAYGARHIYLPRPLAIYRISDAQMTADMLLSDEGQIASLAGLLDFGLLDDRLTSKALARVNQIQVRLDLMRAVALRSELEQRLAHRDYEHALRDYIQARRAFSSPLKYCLGLAVGVVSRRLLGRLLALTPSPEDSPSRPSTVVAAGSGLNEETVPVNSCAQQASEMSTEPVLPTAITSTRGTLLVLTENSGPGGGASYLKDLIRAVQPLYGTIVLVCNRGGLSHWDFSEEMFKNGSLQRAEYSYLTRAAVYRTLSHMSGKITVAGVWLYEHCSPWFHRRLARRILLRHRPAAVFCANHAAQSIIWPMMDLCGIRGIPAAMYLLGMPDMYSRLPERMQAKFDMRMWEASRFVIVNARAVADATEHQRQLPRGKAVLIPNGLPDVPVRHPRSAGTTVAVGTLGRLTAAKGLHHLLDAVAVLCAEGLEVRVLVAGEGAEGESLREQASRLRIDDTVDFKGFIADSDVIDFLAGIDIFVLPSLSEGLPYVLSEAMRAGVAIIATAVGGVPEMIDDDMTGLLVQPGNHLELAEAIERLVGDSDLRQRMALNARRCFEERHRNDAMLEAIRNAFIHGGMVPGTVTTGTGADDASSSDEVDAPCV